MFAAEKLEAREELPLNKEKNDPEKRTFIEKLYEIKSNITVEPIFAGLIIPSMLARLAIQNLNLDKACRVKLNYGDEICDSLILRKGNLTEYEGEVQKIISSIDAWKSIIQTAIPTVLVIFMGAWSDRTGNRKVCILLPVIGELLVSISNILSTIFFYEIPVEVTMFFEAFFPAITGNWVLVYLGVFSYISDITNEKSRTFRVGIVNLCLTAGIPIGTSLSGILLHLWGYYGVFFISSSIYVLVLIYGYFYLKSNTKPKDDEKSQEPVTCKDIYTFVKETMAVAFKKREGARRTKIILTLLAVAIIYGPSHGERNIKYLFVRYRLKWDALKYSMYSTYSTIMHSMGALFSISVFSKRWGFHDSLLCLISIGSNLIGCVYIAFVTTDLGMFMLPVVEILNATTFTSLRSMSSKLIGAEELGKMNSLFSLVETLAALVFDPSYSIMYAATLPIFSGTIYIFSAFMIVPSMIILLYLFAQHRRETRDARAQALKEESPKTDKTEAENSVTKM